MTLIRSTPLIEEHRALGAKLVDFAGWEMPLHYGSQLGEHHAVRRDAGMFDVSHMLAIDVEGEGAADFLRVLLANDVAKLGAAGKALYSCLLDDTGRVLDDLIVYRMGGNGFRLVVNAGTADKDLAWIEKRRPIQVVIAARRDLAMIAVQGPQAREKTWRALPQARAFTETLRPFHSACGDDLMIARTGYTGEDGFEILLPAARAVAVWRALAAQGVAPAGLGARDTLRLEAGMNLYGQDMDETVTPLESGLSWTVDFSGDRPFVGRCALEGSAATRALTGLVLLAGGVMRSHQPVRCAHGDGITTSGGYSPTMDRSIALARLPAAVAPGDDVEVQVRNKWLTARVVKPPFVRNGVVRVTV